MVLLPESIPFLAELMEGKRTKLNGRDTSLCNPSLQVTH